MTNFLVSYKESSTNSFYILMATLQLQLSIITLTLSNKDIHYIPRMYSCPPPLLFRGIMTSLLYIYNAVAILYIKQRGHNGGTMV